MDELPPIDFMAQLNSNQTNNSQENDNEKKEESQNSQNSQNQSAEKSPISKHPAPENLSGDDVISLENNEENNLPPIDKVLNDLDEIKLNSLLTLFNMPITGTREEKITAFVEQTFPEYSEMAPDLDSTLILFIQQLSVNNDIANYILNPPIPSCLTHSETLPFCTKPIQYYKTGFTLEVPVSPGKADNNVVIASIISPFQTNPQKLPIYVGNKETYPCSFGEEGHQYYILYSSKKSLKTVQVSFPPVFENVFAFFTIHFCVKKHVETIMKNVMRNIGIAYDSDIDLKELYAKSKKCRCKSFKFQQFIKDTIDLGTCKCPNCGCDLLLTDIMLELKKKEVSNVDRIQEISIAAPNLANSLCYLTKMNYDNNMLSNVLFDDINDSLDDVKWIPKQSPINGGIEAYIKSFDDLILQS